MEKIIVGKCDCYKEQIIENNLSKADIRKQIEKILSRYSDDVTFCEVRCLITLLVLKDEK